MVKYFLGANTPGGFYSLFDELYFENFDGRLYVIKGGPGTGKSSVMKKIADEAQNRGYRTERIYCSSDPSSLDAVIIPEIKTAVADGTSPHVIEPRYPGAVETVVNMGECWDSGFLKSNAGNIIEKADECSECHRRCVRFLKGYAALENDNRRLAADCLDRQKADDFIRRIALREFESKNKDGRGKIQRRFLSALTPEGITLFDGTVKELCDRVIVFEDEYGVFSGKALAFIAKKAVDNGFDVTVCPCITNPKSRLDHIIIPEKRLCFFTSNNAHKPGFEATKTVSSNRFLNTSQLKKHSARMSFNTRAANELLDEASLLLSRAKSIHDGLEEYYISAMDFDKVEEKSEALVKEIFD